MITTYSGAQGIFLEESGLIIVENKIQLLMAIERLKSDEAYFQKISELGKSYIQKYHSFARVKRVIQDALES